MRRRRSSTERLFIAQTRTVGRGAGRSLLPAPIPQLAPPGTLQNRPPVQWSYAPSGYSPVHELQEGGLLGVWRVLLNPASASDVDIDVILDGATLETLTVTAGTTATDWDLSAYYADPYALVTVAIAALPDDAAISILTPLA